MPRKLGRPKIPRGGFRVLVVDKDWVKPQPKYPRVKRSKQLVTEDQRTYPRYKLKITRSRTRKRIVLFDSWAVNNKVIMNGKLREWIAEVGAGSEKALREAAALCLELNE